MLDCECDKGYLREPLSKEEPLEKCREPRSCNARQFLLQNNLTGEESHKLTRGSCGVFVNSTSGTMPSGRSCKLFCPQGAAPQLAANWMTAVETSLACKDGMIAGPQPHTWCSKTSFEIPPVVFLAVVTLASVVAGFRMEVRQFRFEESCLEAMHPRGGHTHGKKDA